MISVIVPIYKSEKYLRKCVSSIQSQTYTDLEIILVDDCSPDSCGKICDELAKKDKRIKVIHQENGGQSSARNTGLRTATGDYVTFVDSDDTIEPQMMETLLTMMKGNKDIDISICGHRVVYENSKVISRHNDSSSNIKILNKEELWQEIFGKLNNAVWNKMYRSYLLEGLEFSKGIAHGEDLLFNLEYLAKCKMGVITGVQLYNYLKHEGSVTGSGFSENKLYEIESKDRALELVVRYMPEQIKNARIYCFRARMNVLRAMYKAGQTEVYQKNVKKYISYVRENYCMVKHALKMKEKIEYWLLSMWPSVYKIIIARRWK